MSKAVVSVIIVNWNGGEILKDCLDSLSKIRGINWELVLVDNGSTDQSEKLPLKYKKPIKNYKLIKNSDNLGFAPANNQGVKKASGKYILLLNNDTIVFADLFKELIKKIETDPYIGVIQPKIYLMDKKDYLDNAGSFLTRIGFLTHWGFMQKDGLEYQSEREIFSAKGACMLIRADLVKKIGLFDDDFFSYFEESDFCWRVHLAGYKVIFYPKTFIFHKLGYTIKRMNVFNLNYQYYKNRICSLIKNLELKTMPQVLGSHIIISLGIALLFALRGNVGNSLLIFRSFWWNIKNISKTLKKREKIQKSRVISDDQLFDRLSQPVNWQKYFSDFKRVEKDLS